MRIDTNEDSSSIYNGNDSTILVYYVVMCVCVCVACGVCGRMCVCAAPFAL